LSVLDIGQYGALRDAIAFQFIRYDHAWHISQALQQWFEEALTSNMEGAALTRGSNIP
jgi:hypothetical protein